MKLILVIIFLFFNLSSQTLLHPLKIHSENKKPNFKNNLDTVKILALRVQFLKDYDERTNGNGEFDLSISTQYYLDAPPRDSNYFAEHLEFAKNYFHKSSNGQQIISSTIFPALVTVSDSMSKFSSSGSNYSKLGNLIQEAWQKADSLRPNFPIEKYDMFVIFHAGVGKDIDLRSALGYDPTPYDLPSIYFNLATFQKYFGNNFTGINLKNRNYKITNTALLPETENRYLPSISGQTLYKLGINGLIASMIGSHLGLPDLFNTKTGRSVIGRFGLMDGESIFSFHGMFPPEPSAWEKIKLGWVEPIIITKNQKSILVPAASKTNSIKDTIYKIPISAKEYFLIENRNRDANQNNLEVTFKWRGSEIKKIFTGDDDSLSFQSNNSIFGNLINADEFDWSLPGLKTNIFSFQGGILIWHINENIIEKNISSNTINADDKNRGVSLVEADGSNDIGKNFNMLHPASGTESGSIYDYWFKENDYSPFYKNEFSENTIPNSKSQTGSHTNIVIKNFSSVSTNATFDFEKSKSNINSILVHKNALLRNKLASFPVLENANNNALPELFYNSGDSIFCFTLEGSPLLNNSTGLFSTKGGKSEIILFENLKLSSSKLVAALSDSSIIIIKTIDEDNDGQADILKTLNANELITTPLVLNTSDDRKQFIYYGTKSGRVYRIQIDTSVIEKEKLFELDSEIKFLILSKDELLAVAETKIKNNSGILWNINSKINSASYISNTNSNLIPRIVILTSEGKLILINRSDNSTTEYILNNFPTAPHSITDLNNDGLVDIMFPTKNGLMAYQLNGVQIEKFPIYAKDGGGISSASIITGKINSKEKLIFFGSENGHIYNYTNLGILNPDFPQQTGGINSSLSIYNSYLAASSIDSSIYVWKLENTIDTTKSFWNNIYGDKYHTNNYSITELIPITGNELVNPNSVYNWPNPVYENKTYIRYHLNTDVNISIKIYSITGEKIKELIGTNFVGMDNEVEWDVNSVKSGIYFAHVNAEKNGVQFKKLIKIAVIK
ncbi:MAG: T9SS type A sorting domain-containing protein [Bacteroidetes bacterium]|nr:T9SS type A sorting domain-containing protein [Bacteroidota bacterium]